MRRALVVLLVTGSIFPSFSYADQLTQQVGKDQIVGASEDALSFLFSETNRSTMEAVAIKERVRFLTALFVNNKTPYVIDPLGEGPEGVVSQGPLYRFDGFDCTTFVETVLALSRSSTPEEFKTLMNRIRYKDGIVSYQTRNHFPSVDWIPNNTKAGFVRDITVLVGGDQTRWSETLIEKENWFSMKGPEFAEMGKGFGKEMGRLPYLAKADLLNASLVDRIPSGTIFHVVRPNWNLRAVIGTDLDVSHMGFLIREGGVLYMVHASNGLRDGGEDYRGVKREPLRDYVERVMMKSPTMAGLNILGIRGR